MKHPLVEDANVGTDARISTGCGVVEAANIRGCDLG
jgi:hypothetical protein